MAKRVSPEEKAWNPVEAKLVSDVLNPIHDTNSNEAESPAPSLPRVVNLDTHRSQPPSRLTPENSDEKKDVEKLTREKRYLLTESEEDTLERLVKDMGKRLGTSLTLSNVVRATVTLLVHSQDELLKQAEKAGRLKRPPNNDAAALANFEHNIAAIIDRAIRGSRVID